MTAHLHTDNIDRLRAEPLRPDAPGGGWRVSFRSQHAGLCHQLYVNGRLADFTDTPGGRTFHLPAAAEPRELYVAAVAPAGRADDHNAELPADVRRPGWMYAVRVPLTSRYRPGDRLAVHTDRGTGTPDAEPLIERALSPTWCARWGFGDSAFGRGALGYGGIGAPGLGRGGFGAGLFGFGAEVLDLRVALSDPVTHTITLRNRPAVGEASDAPGGQIVAAPPPTPPSGLAATGYDPQTAMLTLEIQESTP
ncbi:MAG: hypothetical protein KGY99_06080 [Phycisphaerae bacterium]|nr:hypothetical protein [Phycisphaerae bacterium]